ncbi:MAG: 1-(5-phosphoribosyl)-5-[(5-phosphoribosylamino)methylideneamino]imidazole-4-carboxamide isomerase [Candidatus Bathyarchaeia archaeon]
MKIIPAVDLINGKVARLFQGDPNKAKFYNHLGDPVAIAKKWEAEGADAIHIVDLDGAFNRGSNLETIAQIINMVNVPVQVGGGIRSREKAEALLSMGADYIVIGTLAFHKPEILGELAGKFGERVIVALDHTDGKVMIKGWTLQTDVKVEMALERFLRMGVRSFLLTAIRRDGTLQGADLETLRQVCKNSEAKVMVAGGVKSLIDIYALKKCGVYGVIIGKALYEGILTLKEIIKAARGG